jgi:hypothetical protein
LTSGWVGGNSAYTTVNSNSATNWNYQGTDIKELTGNYTSVYTNVNSNSADWGITIDSGVRALTGYYTSAYTTVNSNSATTWNYQGTDIKELTGNYTSVYSLVNTSSATWNSTFASAGADVLVRSLTSNWDGGFSAYSTVNTNSANYILDNGNTKGSNLLIGTNDNFNLALETNGSPRVTILNSGNVGIGTSEPNKDLTVKGELSAFGDMWTTGRILSAGQDLSNIIASSSPRFNQDLTISLSNGKTFGRYATGQVIPATGKTAAEVIQMAIAESIIPTASLTSPTTISFNLTGINNVLNFSHAINTLGATVASASLQWRRNNSGSWTVLSTSTTTPGTYTHTLTDTSFNTQPFNYRYIVTDTATASITATRDITPSAYVAPTMTLTVAGSSVSSPETNSIREKGNIGSNITGSITRNSANVALSGFVIQFQVDSGAWTDIAGTETSISGSSYTISTVPHYPSAHTGASTISYRIKVTDAYTISYSSTSTITFKNLIFYGPSSSAPTNSNQVRSLPSRIFIDGENPFILNTGTTNTKFTVAIPTTLSITQVLDLDSSSANLTTVYVNNPFTVNDFAGTAVNYKVYTLSTSIPYTPNHRHQVSRG